MGRFVQVASCWAGMLLLSALLASCAGLPYLTLRYQLPSGMDEMGGRRASFSLVDERPAGPILGSGAWEEFGSGPASVSLAVARGSETGLKTGIYEFPQFLKEAFQRRFEHAGLIVVSPGEPAGVEISIAVREFFLDLVGRKWQFRMAYEARLVKDGRVAATQSIQGEGERFKLLGRDQAEEIVGEIFTDTLNQLDLRRLFRQGGL